MDSKIALNFLPLENQKFEINLFRKIKDGNNVKPDHAIKEYRLPTNINNQNDWRSYWITFDKNEGFEEFNCLSTTNKFLTELYLYIKLKEKSQLILPGKIFSTNNEFYSKKINYIIKETPFGNQVVWLNPFFLERTSEYGFLMDFDFIKGNKIEFTKEVQKYSLSLDENYRSNKNFHLDKYDFIRRFVYNLLPNIEGISNSIRIAKKMRTLSVEALGTKTYRFNNEENSISQFNGLKKYSPFKSIKDTPNFYFIFRDEDIDFARDLVKALAGSLFNTFDGLNSMFNLDFKLGKSSTNIKSLIIVDYNDENINKILNHFLGDNTNKIAIFIFPEVMEEYYFSIKNRLLKYNIVTQGVHLETLKDENKFKWSVSSLALQIFAKLGGIPWRMKPSNNNCLIIGVNQAHEENTDVNGYAYIKKYFSYSVLMDSSGEYLSMKVLSQNENEKQYLIELENAIKNALSINEKNYEKITLHIPYKIKHSEIERIMNAAKSIKNEIELVILKINDHSNYFGYNIEHNSMIPYESSYIGLSQRDYLLWTEGLNYHNNKVNKHYANPLHINFYYSNKALAEINKTCYLQDILNLTGANWRGFNAKSIPISMFYPKIISKFIKFFNKYNLETVEFEKLPPWFL